MRRDAHRKKERRFFFTQVLDTADRFERAAEINFSAQAICTVDHVECCAARQRTAR
jgi:hypothetical protein